MTEITKITYRLGAELPDASFTWRSSGGVIIPFATQPHTFSFRVFSPAPFIKGVLGGSQPGFTGFDASPNVTVAFNQGELDAIDPGTWFAELWARRTTDGKDRNPLPFLFKLESDPE